MDSSFFSKLSLIFFNPGKKKQPRKYGTLRKYQTYEEQSQRKEKKPFVCTDNNFNNIIQQNSPNLKKKICIKVQEAYRTPNRKDYKRKSPCHILFKISNVQNKNIKKKLQWKMTKSHIKADLQNNTCVFNEVSKSQNGLSVCSTRITDASPGYYIQQKHQ